MTTIRALWTLARPKGMALISLLPIIGFTFAYWDHGCTIPELEALPYLAVLATLWAVPHMGTMWLNAALDRDEGQVLFGESVPVPDGIEVWAYLTLILAVFGAFYADVALGACVLGCAALSILYSHPKTAWKGHALLGPAANAIGYGVLSPLGGFLYSGLPPSPRGALVLCVSVSFMLSAYLAAQAFQEKEDRERGYHTLVALRGARTTLTVTRAFLVVSVLLTLGLGVIGWFPRAVLISAPAFFAADRLLARWREQPGGGDETWARSFFKRLTLAGLLCVGGASAHFAWQQHMGQPLGGLGTVSGHPSNAYCR